MSSTSQTLTELRARARADYLATHPPPPERPSQEEQMKVVMANRDYLVAEWRKNPSAFPVGKWVLIQGAEKGNGVIRQADYRGELSVLITGACYLTKMSADPSVMEAVEVH